jgi:serine phosphatase RsbU (regulator of sigma subunit)
MLLRLEAVGAPVGMFEDSRHQSTVIQLREGDLLVACTGGIIEAENAGGEVWGQERLEALFWRTDHCLATCPISVR